jgi:cell division protein ZapA
MSNVTLDIAGRKFTVACGPGEEPHIETLGQIIDAKIEGMPGLATQSEARCLLYAALLMADELHELRAGGQSAVSSSGQVDPQSADRLERLAGALEDLAQQLENAG